MVSGLAGMLKRLAALCWEPCRNFAPANHLALVRGLFCDRYQLQLCGFSADDAEKLTTKLKLLWHSSDQILS
jgi:hypothetical protein